MHRYSRLFSVIFIVLVSAVAQARQLAVVVDRANNIGAVTAKDLAKILKSGGKWPDGRGITLVIQDPDGPDMGQVCQRLGISLADVKAALSAHKASFVVVKADDQLVKMVSGTPGAVGFVDVYSITGSVNVLKVDGKLPLEPGYLLH